MATKKQANKDVDNWNNIGKEIHFKGEKNSGKIKDFVSFTYKGEKHYKHMIEKIEEGRSFRFRVGYATRFNRNGNYFANFGSQMASTTYEHQFYTMLERAFKRENFFKKSFKKRLLKILSKEF